MYYIYNLLPVACESYYWRCTWCINYFSNQKMNFKILIEIFWTAPKYFRALATALKWRSYSALSATNKTGGFLRYYTCTWKGCSCNGCSFFSSLLQLSPDPKGWVSMLYLSGRRSQGKLRSSCALMPLSYSFSKLVFFLTRPNVCLPSIHLYTMTQTQNLCKMSTPSLKPKIYAKCLHHHSNPKSMQNVYTITQTQNLYKMFTPYPTEWMNSFPNLYILYILFFHHNQSFSLAIQNFSDFNDIYTILFLVKMRVFSFTMECHLLGFNFNNIILTPFSAWMVIYLYWEIKWIISIFFIPVLLLLFESTKDTVWMHLIVFLLNFLTVYIV